MAETANPEAEPLFSLLKERYGGRLTPEQLAEIRKMVEGQLEAARALRVIRLTNADEPFQAFTPYRSDQAPHPTLSPEGRGEGNRGEEAPHPPPEGRGEASPKRGEG